MKWAQEVYWPMWTGRKMKRKVWKEMGLMFGPGLTLPFGFALVQLKPPFKHEPKPKGAK